MNEIATVNTYLKRRHFSSVSVFEINKLVRARKNGLNPCYQFQTMTARERSATRQIPLVGHRILI